MIERLHYITQEGPQGQSHAQMARRACEAGVRWVQLRIKNATADAIRQQAKETLAVCREFGAVMLVNDHVDIAAEIGADGVHLGKQDMDPAEARKILGDKLIGGTANEYADVEALIDKGVDYVGLGPFRYTATKEKLSPILGLAGYQKIYEQLRAADLSIPIVAIGGLLPADVTALRQAGLHGIAVASVINQAADPVKVLEELNSKLYGIADSRQVI